MDLFEIMHYEDKFMIVSEEKGIVSLTWKNGTKSLTQENFKEEALRFVDIVKKS